MIVLSVIHTWALSYLLACFVALQIQTSFMWICVHTFVIYASFHIVVDRSPDHKRPIFIFASFIILRAASVHSFLPKIRIERHTHHSNQNHQAAGAGRGRGSWAAGNGHGGGRRRDHDDEGAAAPPLLPLLLRHLPPRSVPVSAAFPVRSPSSAYPVSPNLRSLSPRSRGQAADCRRRQGQAGAKPAQHARRFSVPCHFWGMGLVGWRFLKC